MSQDSLNGALQKDKLVPVKSVKEEFDQKLVRYFLAEKPTGDLAAYPVAFGKAITSLTEIPAERMEIRLEPPKQTLSPSIAPTTTNVPSTVPTGSAAPTATGAPSSTDAPTDASVAPSDVPTDASVAPSDVPTDATSSAPTAKRALAQSEEWSVVVVIKELKGNIALYIIIGVISAVALIITVVLIISLNKKKTSPEYQQIDDDEYANDKMMTNNY